MPFGKTMSVRESAAYLKVSTKTVRRYIRRDLLKCKTVEGKHGNEIRVFKQSLDKVIGQIQRLSKGQEDVLEMNRLFAKASPEVREVVLKILRSSGTTQEEKKSNGIIASLFGRKGDEYQ